MLIFHFSSSYRQRMYEQFIIGYTYAICVKVNAQKKCDIITEARMGKDNLWCLIFISVRICCLVFISSVLFLGETELFYFLFLQLFCRSVKSGICAIWLLIDSDTLSPGNFSDRSVEPTSMIIQVCSSSAQSSIF